MLVSGTGCGRLFVLGTGRTDHVAERDLAAHERVHDRLYASGDAETTLGVLDVVVNRALADAENLARHPVALALSCELEALTLAPRESTRQQRTARFRFEIPAQRLVHVAG